MKSISQQKTMRGEEEEAEYFSALLTFQNYLKQQFVLQHFRVQFKVLKDIYHYVNHGQSIYAGLLFGR